MICERRTPIARWTRTVALAFGCVLLLLPTADAAPPKGKATAKPVSPQRARKKASDKPAPKDAGRTPTAPKTGKDVDAETPTDSDASPAHEAAAKDDARSLRRGERVEFDDRLIQGQTAKAGAVHLFARVSTNLVSMVDERTSFRDKILRTVFKEDDTTKKRQREGKKAAVVVTPKEPEKTQKGGGP